MRTPFLFVALIASFVASVSAAQASEPKEDAATIQGEWGAQANVENGEDVFGEKIDPKESPVRWDFEKTKVYFLAAVEEATVECSYKRHSTSKPRKIDFVMKSPQNPKQEQRLKGIYELKGDKFRVCYGPAGADRPKKFESKKGSKRILIEFGRVKL